MGKLARTVPLPCLGDHDRYSCISVLPAPKCWQATALDPDKRHADLESFTINSTSSYPTLRGAAKYA